jgi:hypothetical protein
LGKEGKVSAVSTNAENDLGPQKVFSVQVEESKDPITGEAIVKLKCRGPREGHELDSWEEDVFCLACKEKIE